MGKASSAKKVARVARASGGPAREQRKLGFPMAIFAIVVLGSLLVAWGRADRNSAVAQSPTLTDHWHAAYGIQVCDDFLPALSDIGPDTTGIHTHAEDGAVIHVHPFSQAATGTNATWGKFGEMVGLSFDGSSFTVNGVTYADGYDCGGQPATVSLHEWAADDLDAPPTIFTEDLGDVRFTRDRLVYTLAVVPEGTEVRKPDSVPLLDNLSDVPTSGESTDPLLDPSVSLDPSATLEPNAEIEVPAEGAPSADDTAVDGAPVDGAEPATTVPTPAGP